MYFLFRDVGEDGRDFITVEHCGDDFLAALAESMEDTEEWDDLGDAELEASRDLGEMFKDEVIGSSCKGNGKDVFVIDDDDSPVQRDKSMKFVELDSSSDSELSFGTRKRRLGESTPASCSYWQRSSSDFAQSSGSVVRISLMKVFQSHFLCGFLEFSASSVHESHGDFLGNF